MNETINKIYLLLSSTTNATVSVDSWQHLCFSIDTIQNLWSFYKNGVLTDIALSRVSSFSSDALDNDDNQVFLGQDPKEVSHVCWYSDYEITAYTHLVH